MEPSNHPGKNLIGRLRWQEVCGVIESFTRDLCRVSRWDVYIFLYLRRQKLPWG